MCMYQELFLAYHIPRELESIAAQVEQGGAPKEIVRRMLWWFATDRFDFRTHQYIRRALGEVGLKTVPDFEYEFLDNSASFLPLDQGDECSLDAAGQRTRSASRPNGGTLGTVR